MIKPSQGFWHMRGIFNSGMRYFDVAMRVIEFLVFGIWTRTFVQFFMCEFMLTVDTV